MRARPASAVALALPEQVAVPGERDLHRPVVDGHVLTDRPLELLRQGRQHRVPVIVGPNRDEPAQMMPLVATCEAYATWVRRFPAAMADALLEAFPCASYPTPRAALDAP
jgi:carboxylesterase type B